MLAGSESCCHGVPGAPVRPGPRAAHRAGTRSTPRAPGWGQCTGGDPFSIGRDQLDQEPSQAARSRGEGWGQEEKPQHSSDIQTVAPSQGGHPAADAPSTASDGGDQGGHRGHLALTFAPRRSRSGNPGTTCSTLRKCPAMSRGWDSDADTWLRQGHSPTPCSGTTQHVVALRQVDGLSHPPTRPRAPTSTAERAIAVGLGRLAASPTTQPQPQV